MASSKRTKKSRDGAAVATPPVGGDVSKKQAAPEVTTPPEATGSAKEGSAQPWLVDGQYEILHEVGRGGMCNLYLATHRRLGGEWAVKVLADDLARDPGIVERFHQEARILAELQHPNIVKVVGVGEDKGLPFMVMNYVPGEDLTARLERSGRLQEKEAVSIALHIARALECAHESGIVHRDLKPSNIRIDFWGTVVVLDFGIARARDAGRLTQSGDRIGTPLYMSPEQTMGEAVDTRSDLYSLGVILYELFSGTNPFQVDGQDAIHWRQVHYSPPPLRTIVPKISVGLSDLVEGLLRKDPAQRPQSAKEVLSVLTKHRGSVDIKTPRPNQVAGGVLESDQSGADPPPLAESTEMPGLGTIADRKPSAPSALVQDHEARPGVEEGSVGGLSIFERLGIPKWIAVSLVAGLAAVLTLAAMVWRISQPTVEHPLAIDASPFAGVEILDSDRRVVRQAETPAHFSLPAGDYVVRWVYRSQAKVRNIRLPLVSGQPLFEDFKERDDTEKLLDEYLETAR